MLKHSGFATISSLLLCGTSAAYAKTLSGNWNGKPYYLTIENAGVTGNVGTARVQFKVSSNEISGTLFSKQFFVRIDRTAISGLLPCGKIFYAFARSSKTISGEHCGNLFDVRVDARDDVMMTVGNLIADPIVEGFPYPVKKEVRDYILQSLNLR